MGYGESDQYNFQQSEYEQVLRLFTNLQKEITKALNLPDLTRAKLYEKLEETILKMEIRVESLDIFWSFIARAEIAYKVYENGKIPQSLKNFAKLIWQVQCREEGRPLNSTPPIQL